jgi:hypothetical protein
VQNRTSAETAEPQSPHTTTSTLYELANSSNDQHFGALVNVSQPMGIPAENEGGSAAAVAIVINITPPSARADADADEARRFDSECERLADVQIRATTRTLVNRPYAMELG